MHRHSRSRAPAIAAVGIGLVALPALGYALAANRHRKGSDTAPGYTARRSFGHYDVVGRTVTIRRPREELFRTWRDFANLPDFMANLEKVAPHPDDPARNTWYLKAPAGKTLAVETTIAREIENELIAWRSTQDSDLDTEGRVTFEDAPGERGTRVGLIIAWHPRGGIASKVVAKLSGKSPELQARHDLKRFKMLMETGEIATSVRRRENEAAADRAERPTPNEEMT
ncbi:MAG: cyclase [Porphyrobacter sp.]|nr:cyclase [Porphyrobacter sp.]